MRASVSEGSPDICCFKFVRWNADAATSQADRLTYNSGACLASLRGPTSCWSTSLAQPYSYSHLNVLASAARFQASSNEVSVVKG